MLNDSIDAAGEAARHEIQTTTPGCLKAIIGRTCKFQLKIKDYNFSASRQTFTVSRIINDAAVFGEVDGTAAASEVTDNNGGTSTLGTEDATASQKEKRQRLGN